MDYSDMSFCEFIIHKRKEKQLSARQLAIAAGITPEYMCEIEKGRKTGFSDEVIDSLVGALALSEEEAARFYDLAAIARNSVSADLPKYIMENELVRTALRMAKKNNTPDEKWEKFISEIVKKE